MANKKHLVLATFFKVQCLHRRIQGHKKGNLAHKSSTTCIVTASSKAKFVVCRVLLGYFPA
jgi:hypothetical protein